MEDLSKYAPGKINGKTFNEWPAWEGDGLPLAENCDLRNPRQAFLFAFTAMPAMKGAPLILPTSYWELQSWRMWQLGMRPTGRKRHLKYAAPASMMNAWTAQGEWVTLDKEEPAPKTLREVVQELPQQDQMQLRQIFAEQLGLEGDTTVPVPDNMFRADDLARRLELSLEDLQEVLSHFGITARGPADLIDRAVADRILAHLGL